MKYPWRSRKGEAPGTSPGNYESDIVVDSRVAPGVRYTVAKMSFGRRLELMRHVRELARRTEFLAASGEPGDRMEGALIRAEIDRLYVKWGLRAVSGLVVDGETAGPDLLADSGPEELFREAVAAVRHQMGLSEEERKN